MTIEFEDRVRGVPRSPNLKDHPVLFSAKQLQPTAASMSGKLYCAAAKWQNLGNSAVVAALEGSG